MEDGRIPKDLLFGELATGARPTGRPCLRFKDVCKRDLKDCSVSPADLQSAISDRNKWRTLTKLGCRQSEEQKTGDLKRREKKESRNPSQRTPSLHAPVLVEPATLAFASSVTASATGADFMGKLVKT